MDSQTYCKVLPFYYIYIYFFIFLYTFSYLWNFLSLCLVHASHANRHHTSGVERKRRFSLRCPPDPSEAHRPDHQHTSAGHHQGAGHSVSAASVYQVRSYLNIYT